MKSSHISLKAKQKGNLAEYLLPAVLISGVVLVSITSLIQSNVFGSTRAQGLLQAQSLSKDAQGKALLNIRTMGQNPFYQPYQYKTTDGKTITIPEFPSNLAAAVEVDGGHGTTEKLLAAMEDWIQALLDAGEITETQANALKDLANQGHTIAAHLKLHEDILARCGESKACVENAIYSSSGQTQNPLHLGIVSTQRAQAYPGSGFFQPSPLEINTLYELSPLQRSLTNRFSGSSNNISVGKPVLDFIQKYEAAKNLLTANSPSSVSLLKYFSSSIMGLGFSSASALHEVSSSMSAEILDSLNSQRHQDFGQNISPQNYNAVLAAWTEVNDQTSRSELAHDHSGSICQMGQGESNPTECL